MVELTEDEYVEIADCILDGEESGSVAREDELINWTLNLEEIKTK